MDILSFDDLELAVDRRGDGVAGTILLLAGGGQSMDWWPPELCDALAARGHAVIRYDHRDTGQSSVSPVGEPAYTADDLVADPLRILDAFGEPRAHLVGMSMGSGMAQALAVQHADRVASLTLIASSPAGGDRDALPESAPAILESFEHPEPEPDWNDEQAVIDYRVAIERPYIGRLGFDEPRLRATATEEVRRSRNVAAGLTNHFVAEGSTAVDPADISQSTLVLHGTDDPFFPIGHGEALVRAIRRSHLIPLAGMGHEIPPPALWPVVVPAILNHVESAGAPSR